jgi:hypothetical protein
VGKTVPYPAEIFIPLTNLMGSAIRSGRLRGEARFLTQVFGGLVNSFIARAAEFNMDHQNLAKELVTFFLRGAA